MVNVVGERAVRVGVKISYDAVIDPRYDPLTRPAPADENAVAVHPLPQGGEGWVFTQALSAGLLLAHPKQFDGHLF